MEEENLFDELDTQEKEELTPSEPEDRSTESTYVEESNTKDSKDQQVEEDLYNDEEESDEDNTEDNDDSSLSSNSIYEFLVNKGYIEYDKDLDLANLNEEDFDSYIEEQLDRTVDTKISEALQDLPDIVRQLNEYALSGGDVREFFSKIAYQNSQGITDNMDINDPKTQEIIVYNTLKNQNYSDEFIYSQIEFLKSNNTLGVHASEYYNQYLYNKQEEINKEVELQRQRELQAREHIAKQKEQLNKYLTSIDSIGDIPLSFRDKRELSSYMLDGVYKLDNGNVITQLQKDLYYDLMNNSEAAITLAVLLKNRNEDGSFNLSFLENKAKSKVARNIKKNLERNDRTTPKSSNKSREVSYKKKSLVDYL